jgi:hypothetical protein
MTRQDRGSGPVRLSPEAELLLDRVLDNWRSEVIALAHREQVARGPAEELVSPSDIRSAMSKLNFAVRDAAFDKVAQNRSLRRLLIVATAASATILLAIGAYLLSTLGKTRADEAANIIGASGSVIAFVIGILSIHYARRSFVDIDSASRIVDATLDEAEFLRRWAQLEAAIRARVSRSEGGDFARKPLRSVLESYAELERLDKRETADLFSMLHLRNRATHSPIGDIDKNTLEEGLSILTRQLERATRIQST